MPNYDWPVAGAPKLAEALEKVALNAGEKHCEDSPYGRLPT